MGFGGFQPFPRRFGRTKGQPLEVLTNSLLAQLGTAYDAGTGSVVWAKTHATARALWDAWESQVRLRNQFDPRRMTSALPAWERILGIPVGPDATGTSRRAAVALRFSLFSKAATVSTTRDLCASLLPKTFVGMVYDTVTTARQHTRIAVVADGGVTTPTGTRTVAADGLWGSSIHSVHIQTVLPTGMAESDFPKEVSAVYNGTLRRFFPAWMKFNWFRPYSDAFLGTGFQLSTTRNLTYQPLTG